MKNKVTYRDLLKRYGMHELCPKSIPVAGVNECYQKAKSQNIKNAWNCLA